MSAILGISFSNIYIEKGLEHDLITADVIMDEKKIGELVNDGWCDDFYIEFLNISLVQEFEKRMIKYYKRKKIISNSYDVFINELLFKSKEYRSIKNKQLKCEQFTFIW